MRDAGLASAAVVLALALDLLFGDPPNRWHPVAWIGAALDRGRRRLEHGKPSALILRGAGLTLSVAALAAALGWLIALGAARLGPLGVIAEAIAIKSLISLRGLLRAASSVEGELERGRLEAARQLVGYHLVSRPTTALDERLVRSATIESVAENLTDALVGPLCFYLAFGLPGAVAYRVVNTADAMMGYREGTLEWFGKIAARLDDLFNLIPARIAGAALVLAAVLAGGDARGAWSTMRGQHGRTQSPNAGWTMAAMAGALGLSLEKPGAYSLGSGELPGPGDIGRGVRLLRIAALAAVAVLLAAAIGVQALASR